MDQIFERVTAALATLRVGAADSEEQLHRQAAEAFANAGLEAAHEVSFGLRRDAELISWWAASAWRSRKKGRSARRLWRS